MPIRTTTNAHSFYIGASALNASTTNSYGLTVNANTGAGNNYAAQFLSGSVGIGTSTPYFRLTVASSTGAQLSLTDGSLTQTMDRALQVAEYLIGEVRRGR
jgi:hypothetical protein